MFYVDLGAYKEGCRGTWVLKLTLNGGIQKQDEGESQDQPAALEEHLHDDKLTSARPLAR